MYVFFGLHFHVRGCKGGFLTMLHVNEAIALRLGFVLAVPTLTFLLEEALLAVAVR